MSKKSWGRGSDIFSFSRIINEFSVDFINEASIRIEEKVERARMFMMFTLNYANEKGF
jgi:hypothetical protein